MSKVFSFRWVLLVLVLCSFAGAAHLYAYDEEEQGYTNAQGNTQDAQGYDENTQGYDENAQGYDENAQGYTEEEASQQEQDGEAQEAAIEAQEAYSEENEDVYVEEAQDNYQAPVWEGPIPYEPAYSGKENMKIERSTRPKRNKLMGDMESDAKSSPATDKPKQSSVFEGECDPVVSVRVNQEKRFDVLKKLADEHNFEIMMLEEENQPISLEKNAALSRVIESITRDMSVVLNYKKQGDCERLVAISVLDNSEWSGTGGSQLGGISNSRVAEKIRQYKPKFKPISVSRDSDPDSYNGEAASYDTQENLDISSEEYQERQEKIKALQELREKRREARELRSLNKELPRGEQLDNDFYVKDGWKKQREQIDNMEVYVDEVMKGERVPNIRGMTIKQRTEYMRLRREYNHRE